MQLFIIYFTTAFLPEPSFVIKLQEKSYTRRHAPILEVFSHLIAIVLEKCYFFIIIFIIFSSFFLSFLHFISLDDEDDLRKLHHVYCSFMKSVSHTSLFLFRHDMMKFIFIFFSFFFFLNRS